MLGGIQGYVIGILRGEKYLLDNILFKLIIYKLLISFATKKILISLNCLSLKN